jgi:predicted amidohydrolase YtcJ
MRSAIANGLTCSNHTDFSVCPKDPTRGIWSAVTRQSRGGEVIGPDERIARWEALKAITSNAAWQIREEDRKGRIAPGMLADLVIPDGNPLTVETARILDIKAVETFKEGKQVYKRAAA